MTTTYDRCKRETCRSCGAGPLEHVIDMGPQAPSNALLTSADQPSRIHPLKVGVCVNCWLMQTEYDVPHAELFTADYPYYSGGSRQWIEHCDRFAAYATVRFGLHSDSYVVEIGGNDGTMLKRFDCETLNVEPSRNVARAALDRGVSTFIGRFQECVLARRVDLIIANNVLAHDPDLNGFAAAIARNLAEAGTCTIEFPWAVKLLEDCQFDTIYHEHYSYFSITTLDILFARHGLRIYDAKYLPIHGGSIRAYVHHRSHATSSASLHLDNLRAQEELLIMPRVYEVFRERAFNCAGAFHRFLKGREGQVYGMGAAAKATVFANFCALTSKDIPMIGDATPVKWGKFLPGSRIPIVTQTQLLDQSPPYIWIAAWNWKEQIARELRIAGFKGKFVTAIPMLEVF